MTNEIDFEVEEDLDLDELDMDDELTSELMPAEVKTALEKSFGQGMSIIRTQPSSPRPFRNEVGKSHWAISNSII